MFNRTIILITEYEPKVSNAQKRVKLLMPVSSNVVKSTRPNDAQNRDWEVSNKLKRKKMMKITTPFTWSRTREFLYYDYQINGIPDQNQFEK